MQICPFKGTAPGTSCCTQKGKILNPYFSVCNSQITPNAIHSVSFRLVDLSARKYSLFCIQQINFVLSDGPCWETKYYIADLEPSPFTHPCLYRCLHVHVIANARLVRLVLVRLSPNWPNTNDTAVNGRC